MFYMYYTSNKVMRRKHSIFLFLSIMISVIIIFEVVFELIIYPSVSAYVESVLKTKLQTAMNSAVADYLSEEDIKYDDIAVLTKNSDGIVTSMEIDTIDLNIAKAGIANLASEYIDDEQIKVDIPLGSLFGSTLLGGIGPRIPFSIKTASAVFVNFKSEFSDAGINQTLHKINICITCRSTYILPLHKKSFSTDADYVMAQSIIVGVVPDNYTSVIEFGDTTDNTVPNIFDYGTGN